MKIRLCKVVGYSCVDYCVCAPALRLLNSHPIRSDTNGVRLFYACKISGDWAGISCDHASIFPVHASFAERKNYWKEKWRDVLEARELKQLTIHSPLPELLLSQISISVDEKFVAYVAICTLIKRLVWAKFLTQGWVINLDDVHKPFALSLPIDGKHGRDGEGLYPGEGMCCMSSRKLATVANEGDEGKGVRRIVQGGMRDKGMAEGRDVFTI
ncbi:hypothetical protein VNO77_44068 [Canavalia gladiata]|uniref:Uncharacterized protein n=1 Tax=Canavalia gladiata TaxID=3824 RepID=A0AAN9JXD8_CANGL